MASVIFGLGIDLRTRVTFVADDQSRGIGKKQAGYGDIVLNARVTRPALVGA